MLIEGRTFEERIRYSPSEAIKIALVKGRNISNTYVNPALEALGMQLSPLAEDPKDTVDAVKLLTEVENDKVSFTSLQPDCGDLYLRDANIVIDLINRWKFSASKDPQKWIDNLTSPDTKGGRAYHEALQKLEP